MKNEMSETRLITFALLLIASITFNVSAQTEPTGGLSPAETDKIVRTFTAKEAQFRRALNSYSFKRDALLQSIGMGGQVAGEFH